jgi:hypothetical protein
MPSPRFRSSAPLSSFSFVEVGLPFLLFEGCFALS